MRTILSDAETDKPMAIGEILQICLSTNWQTKKYIQYGSNVILCVSFYKKGSRFSLIVLAEDLKR